MPPNSCVDGPEEGNQRHGPVVKGALLNTGVIARASSFPFLHSFGCLIKHITHTGTVHAYRAN